MSGRDQLAAALPAGSIVYTVLEHVSKSGMTRDIKVFAIVDNAPVHLSYSVAALLGYKRHPNRDGVRVHGAGMDMGFHIVYRLSSELHGDGYALQHRWL